jgi:5-methylcytosine-specific restriction endonuclease McrA
MPLIDRNKITDAQRQIEKFIPDQDTRESLLAYLAEMIVYANGINRSNWNLNLDIRGGFLRFNTGQEYCISIFPQAVLVLCLKQVLKKSIDGKDMDLEFTGYDGKLQKTSHNLQNTPDCLAKVPDSVGCFIKSDNIGEYLPFLREANVKFIDFAMTKTTISAQSKNAHSIGSIEYLSKTSHKKIQNPRYEMDEMEFQSIQDKLLAKSKRMTDVDLKKQLSKLPADPKKTNIVTSQYVRNAYVSEFVKRQAKGMCQDCYKPAPFIVKNTGDPYLETHHIIPLSDGGKDNVENVIALCPNCHRKKHYG